MTEKEGIEILLSRYIKGELDQKETSYIEFWINASDEHRKEFERFRRISEEQRVHFSDTEVQKARERVKSILINRLMAKQGKSKRFNVMITVLLILTGSLSLYFAYQPLDDNISAGYCSTFSVKTGNGEQSECTLPDSTHIWLNSNSEICYQLKDQGKLRSVEIKGEAYFDVARKKEIPFEVSNGNIRVKVFGTRFNFKAGDSDVEVTLEEGSLAIYNKEQTEVARLDPGLQAKVSQSGSLVSMIKVDPEAIAGWKCGYFEYQDVSLKEIADKLVELYGVKINFDNETLKEERFRCIINRNKSVLQMLELLKQTSGLDYVIEGSEIIFKQIK